MEATIEIKGGRWLSPEQYAELAAIPVEYVHKLIWPNCSKTTCPKKIDERDLKRFSRKRVSIFFSPPNVSGFDRPRLTERD